jgi:hypothetical protein
MINHPSRSHPRAFLDRIHPAEVAKKTVKSEKPFAESVMESFIAGLNGQIELINQEIAGKLPAVEKGKRDKRWYKHNEAAGRYAAQIKSGISYFKFSDGKNTYTDAGESLKDVRAFYEEIVKQAEANEAELVKEVLDIADNHPKRKALLEAEAAAKQMAEAPKAAAKPKSRAK